MDVTQLRAIDPVAFGFEVGHLTGDQFLASGGDGDFAKDFAQIVARPCLRFGRDFEGDREQRVAGKDGDAVSENFVAGRAAAAEIVVVHAREIVVDE